MYMKVERMTDSQDLKNNDPGSTRAQDDEKIVWIPVILKVLAVAVLLAFVSEPEWNPRRPINIKKIKICHSRRVYYEGAFQMWDMDRDPMQSGIIVYGDGAAGPLGKKLYPEYLDHFEHCRDNGTYYYDSTTRQVSCSVHKREEYPQPRPNLSNE